MIPVFLFANQSLPPAVSKEIVEKKPVQVRFIYKFARLVKSSYSPKIVNRYEILL
jgi:hypothetical protein